MKKLFVVTISAIMVLSMGITAFAAETITEQGGKDIDVKAQAVYVSPEDVYNSPTTDGKADITTKNGNKISVSADSSTLDGLTLNVIEMTKEDKEAYAWISGVMSELGDKFMAYDIYFTDKDGNRMDVTDSVPVSITTPDGYKNVQVYSVGTNGKNTPIDAEQSGENTVFTANGSSYYVLAEQTNENGGTSTTDPVNPSDLSDSLSPSNLSDSETLTNSDNPADSNAPQTGDSSMVWLGLASLVLSGVALTTLEIGKKRRKNAAK